jgi:hypothetical protein
VGTVSIKCPNCGGALELDDSKEFGFCIYCGTQVQIQDEKTRVEVSGSVKFDETEKYGNYLNLATQAYTNNNMSEAYTYYTKALEIKQSDYLPIFRKGLCAGYLSTDGGLRIEEVVSGVSKGHDMAPDQAARQKISREIVAFAVGNKLSLSDHFYSSDDCARYVKTIYGKISLMNRLYPFVDQENVDDATQYIETALDCCKLLNIKTMKYIASTTVRKGKSATIYGTYPVPQNIVIEVADVSKRFTAEFNKFIKPRIDKLSEEINQTKKKIKELPQILQVSHAFCSIWMFLVGLVLVVFGSSVTIAIGFLIWVIQIVLSIIGAVKDKDKTAKGLYKTLKAQKKELVSLNKQLKK